MSEVASYYFELGKQDASKFKGHVKATVEADNSCFYRLGVLSERYKDCPKRLSLIEELYREFSFYNELPNHVVITLKHDYSHRLLKRTMNNLGYHVPARPDFLGFNAWRVF